MQTKTEQIAYIQKQEADKTAYTLDKTYFLLKEMTTPQTPMPEANTEQTYKEFKQQLDQYSKEWEINQAYTSLWLATSHIWICKRRSRKSIRYLLDAIENAQQLGLNIY